MRKQTHKPRRLLSIVLCLALILSYLPATSIIATSSAPPDAGSTIYNGGDGKVADPGTVNDWKDFFGPEKLDTSYVGGVWTDKSVFTSVENYLNATAEEEGADFGLQMLDENNFLVALSAIASTKSVEGYSTLPSDTILVLDLSGSMVDNQAVGATIQAANDAIKELQALNAYNRVGVVAYSGNTENDYSNTNTAEVILPLGRYTAGANGKYLVDTWTTGSDRNSTDHVGVKVASGVTGTKAAGVTAAFSTDNAKDADGGTYIQNGLYQAWQMFEQVTDTTITDDGLQAGVNRMPILVLLSDGAPTTATTSYTNVGRSDSGDGTSNYATNGIAFLTQLTASWVKSKMEQKYGEDALFYTLGLNVGNNDAAKNVLDPSNNNGTDNYWTTFKGLSGNQSMRVAIRGSGNNATTRTVNYISPVSTAWDDEYVTEYFPASNANGLIQAFDSIIEKIVIQSMYYPTLVNSGDINQDGFLVFEDYIGKNMEVKAIKGIQLGTTLYTGETLAYLMASGGMGTEDEPSDIGNELVWSVQKRLGIDKVETARDLLEQAYAHGQLAWYGPGNFSNYIGWYADASGKYVGFWDGVSTDPKDVPAEYAAEAVYAIKSYGYYGAAGEDHRAADTMYATIQVRTTLKDSAEGKTDASEVGDIQVIGRLPASLIPLVEYDIQLNGTDPMNPSSMTVSGATAPSRLIYEVGLSSKIDLLDIKGTAPDALVKDSNGNYVFYTNQWRSIDGYDYSYATNKNTTSYFEPSEENERYYYSVNTPIYTDENGTLYKGTEAPAYSANDLYYHRYLYYTKSGNTVTANWLYEQISEYVLNDSSDLQRQSDGSWIVKKGTVHHYFGDYVAVKESNPTGTLGVSDMPFVHDPEAGIAGSKGAYHIDSYLGNNGKLTIDPYEGIAISKTASTAITDRDQEYTFTITASDNSFDATCTLIVENALGVRTTKSVIFADGEATVTLKHGETAYVLGEDMIDKTFTVAESIDNGAGYYVSSISVDGALVDNASIPVASGVINQVSFYNEKTSEGNLFITKEVHHSQSGQTVPANMLETPFAITVDFGEGLAGETYNVAHSGNDNLTFITVKTDGTYTFTIKDRETIEIFGLPQGTNVTVTESNPGTNFDVSYRSRSHSGDPADVGDTNGHVIIPANANSTVVVTNTYTPTPATVNLNIAGTKDFAVSSYPLTKPITFQFQVQQWDEGNSKWVNIQGKSASVTYNTETGEKTFSISNVLENITYSTPGTYAYQVIEVIPENRAEGISYDRTLWTFSVIVTDTNGKLTAKLLDKDSREIPNTEGSDTALEYKVSFKNTYHTAPVSIDVKKEITDTSNNPETSKQGFQFSAYAATLGSDKKPVTDANGKWTYHAETPNLTLYSDAAGEARFAAAYDAVGSYYYVLKEVNQGKNGWDYDDTVYEIEIVVTGDNDNGFAATLIINGEAISNSTATITFTNTYDPDDVELSLDTAVKKELMGRDLNAGEFTFSVYADLDPNVTSSEDHTDGRLKLTGTNDADGNVTFDGTLTFDKVGTYYFDIKEVKGELGGVTYDETVYDLVVEVTDSNGQLVADYYFEDATGDTVTFTNHYTAEPVPVTLHATKVLEGGIRTLQAGMFEFELCDSSGHVLQTVSNTVADTDGNNVFFDALTFDTAGEYSYIIQEKLPEGVGRGESDSKKLNGTTYDTGVRTIFIKVTDNGNGQLEAEVTYPTDGAKFTNRYELNIPDATTMKIGGTKILKDANGKVVTLGDKKFEFALYFTDSTFTVAENAIPYAIVKNGADGKFEFADLPIDSEGTLYFVVKELEGSYDDIITDSTVYQGVVTVSNVDGTLVPTIKVYVEGKVVSDIAFTNQYEPDSVTPPPTGGSNTLWLWLALMVISGGSIVTLFTKKVRYVPKHLLK